MFTQYTVIELLCMNTYRTEMRLLLHAGLQPAHAEVATTGPYGPLSDLSVQYSMA